MSKERFMALAERAVGKVNEDRLSKACEVVKDEADAFVVIYRDKCNRKYYVHQSGFTSAEGLYAAEILRDVAMNGGDE